MYLVHELCAPAKTGTFLDPFSHVHYHLFWRASCMHSLVPGLLHLKFLIVCSMQKCCAKTMKTGGVEQQCYSSYSRLICWVSWARSEI